MAKRLNETIGLLPHEAKIVGSLLDNFEKTKPESHEAYFDEVASYESRISKFQTSRKSAFEDMHFYQKLIILRYLFKLIDSPGIIDYPSPDDPEVKIGSRITLLSEGSEDYIDVISHEIPGYEPAGVSASVTKDNPIGALLLGRTVDKTIIWNAGKRDYVGVITSIDQEAQKNSHLS